MIIINEVGRRSSIRGAHPLHSTLLPANRNGIGSAGF